MRAALTINGSRADADDLRLALASNYGHFTALRVRDAAVRGLDLHLQRLVHGTRELFASELDLTRLRGWLREAVAGLDGDLSVRVNVFSRAFDRAHPGAAAPPDVLIAVVAAPASQAAQPLRLKSFRYGRELPHVKHVGTFPLFHFRALAQREGFDDALFVGDDRTIAEASIWNIGLFDGTQIVWPQAPQLAGVGMRLLQAGAQKLGIAQIARAVTLDELPAFRAAFLTNASTVAHVVAAIDAHRFSPDADLLLTLQRCHDSQPLQRI